MRAQGATVSTHFSLGLRLELSKVKYLPSHIFFSLHTEESFWKWGARVPDPHLTRAQCLSLFPSTCLSPTLSQILGEDMEADSRQGEWVTARSKPGGGRPGCP